MLFIAVSPRAVPRKAKSSSPVRWGKLRHGEKSELPSINQQGTSRAENWVYVADISAWCSTRQATLAQLLSFRPSFVSPSPMSWIKLLRRVGSSHSMTHMPYPMGTLPTSPSSSSRFWSRRVQWPTLAAVQTSLLPPLRFPGALHASWMLLRLWLIKWLHWI